MIYYERERGGGSIQAMDRQAACSCFLVVWLGRW